MVPALPAPAATTLAGVTWRLVAAAVAAACLLLAPAAARSQDRPSFETAARHAILIDSRSGKVFFEKDADSPMPPASMSKIMTMIMVFEGLRAGRLSLDDEFAISLNAWKTGGASSGGSTMYAVLDSRVKLADLIQGVIVQSANDACIAIAEGIAGTEERFADDMTRRARELGLETSTFRNATGLPAEGHVMTARELASLARYLIEVFPDEYRHYSQPEFTWNKITQQNRNPLLGSYPGADGIKTGYTREAGYGMVASAERDGRRLVAVVTGLKTMRERGREAEKLLDFGFRQFRPVKLFDAGEPVGEARVWGGEAWRVAVAPKDELRVLVSDDERASAEIELVYTGPLRAPVRPGTEVGFVRVRADGRLIARAPVFTAAGVAADTRLWRRAVDSAVYFAFGG